MRRLVSASVTRPLAKVTSQARIDPPAITAALRKLSAPVLLYAGDLDPLVPPDMVRKAAPAFPGATVVVQAGAGHFPWMDDPDTFAGNVAAFLN